MIAPAIADLGETSPASDPSLAWQVRDGDELLGAVVIERLVAGRACGGIRVAPTVTLSELGDLADAMTLKFAFLGIACGGAKAGLAIPEGATADERERRARAFGRALSPLVRFGTYVPGTDLGCSERDLWDVLAGARMPAGLPPPRSPVETSATAVYSGRTAALAAMAALGGDAEGATLAVLGYGRVGAAFAARFVGAGGRLVGVSTACGGIVDPAGLDLAQLEAARARHGADAPLHYPGGRRVAAHEVLGVAADVLAPCATTRMIDGARAPAVRCRVVSPGANAAITPDAEAQLTAAGVTVMPDFVANAGGVLVSHFWPLALPRAAIDALIERRFRAIVDGLVSRAASERTSPAELARALARRNLERLAREPRRAMRHERLIARLGRGRVQRALPPRLIGALVARVARSLGPPRD